MSTHEEQLLNSLYRNWMKAGLSFKYLKNGIQTFVDNEMISLKNDFQSQICRENHLTEAKCTECTTANALPCPTYGICNVRKKGGICLYHDKIDPVKTSRPCPNRICNSLCDKIKNQHFSTKPSWRNSDASQWCTNHWEIAKCYLPTGGYENKRSAADTDCSGLLSVILNCASMQKGLDLVINPPADLVSKLLKIRNDVFHSATLELTDDELAECVDDMIALLQDKKKLLEDQNAQNAVGKLKQLKGGTFLITSEEELDIRRTALKAINEKKQEAIEAIEAKQAEVRAELEGHQDEEKKMQEALKSQQDQIEETTQKSEVMNKSIQKLSERQDDVEIRQTAVEITLKAQIHTTSELKGKINNLQLKLEGLERIEESHKRKICDLRSYLSRKQELQTTLCNIYEGQLSTTAVSPVLEEIEAKVQDVFVELVFCDDLIHQPKTLENRRDSGKKVEGCNVYKRLDLYTAENRRNTGKKVAGYRDILYKKYQKCKNIYVIGDAGMGKTTWCMKLLSTWVRAYKKKAGQILNTNEPTTGDERTLSEFDVVLFASLRHAASDGNIRDMIRHQLFKKHPKLEGITTEVLEKESNKCLIILDGLDEWMPPDKQPCSPLYHHELPGIENLYDCTVITTTRPWKLDELRLNKRDIDRAVKIQGLEDPDLLAERIVDILNEHIIQEMSQNVEKKTFNDFKRHVNEVFHSERYYSLPSFMRVPLILVFMVCIWFDEGKLGKTLTENYRRFIEFLIANTEGTSKKPGRLSNRTRLQALKSKWSKSANSLPKFLQESKTFKDYSELLLKLSHLAFDALFDSRKESTLVFTSASLKEKLSEEELDVAVKIGILTQSKVIGKSLTRMTSLSFLHKTLQEYMAALHLVCSKESGNQATVEKYKQYCSDEYKIKAMENVMLYVCGMNPQLASEMSKHATDGDVDRRQWNSREWSNNEVTENQWIKGDYFYDPLIFFNEVRRANGDVYPSTSSPIYTYNLKIVLDIDETDRENPKTDFREAFKINQELESLPNTLSQMSQLRILILDTVFSIPENPNSIRNFVLNLKESRCKYMSSCAITTCAITLNPTNLHTLELDTVSSCTVKSGPNKSDKSIPEMDIDLKNCQNLNELRCKYMSSCVITLNPTNLHTLELDTVSSCTVVGCGNKSPCDVPSSTSSGQTLGIDCKKLINCQISLSNTCWKIDAVKLDSCEGCKILIQTRNTKEEDQSALHLVSSIGTIECESLTNCKLEITKTSWKIDKVRLDSCEGCELVIQASNTKEEDQSALHLVSSIGTIECGSLTNCKLEITKNSWKIDKVRLDSCEGCELVIQASTTKEDDQSALHQVSSIGTIDCRRLINCKLEISMNSLMINVVRLQSCNGCGFVIQTSSTKEDDQPAQQPVSVIGTTECGSMTYCKLEISKKITLGELNIHQCNMCSLSLLWQSLRSLVLEDIDSMSDVTQSVLKSLEPENNLQTIKCRNIKDMVQRCIHVCVSPFTQVEVSHQCVILHIHAMDTHNPRAFNLSTQSSYPETRIRHLKCEGLSNDASEVLGEIIPIIRQLEVLELSGCDTQVIHSLQYLFYLRHLKCEHFKRPSWEALGKVLPSLKQLEILELNGLPRTRDPVPPSVIQSTGHLTQLRHLTCRHLSKDAWEALGEILCFLTQLEILKLDGLQDNYITLSAIQSVGHLTQLRHLTCRYLSKDAWEALGEILRSLTQLEILKLDGFCHTGSNIPPSVILPIGHLTQLRHITCKRLPHYAWEALGKVLPSLTQIEILELEDHKAHHSKNLVKQSIGHLTQLRQLTCSRLSENGWVALGKVLPSLTQLEILKLDCVKQSSGGLSVIWSIKHLTQLLRHLKCGSFSSDAWVVLSKVLPSLTQLEILELEDHLHTSRIPPSVIQSIGCLIQLRHLTFKSTLIIQESVSKALESALAQLVQLESLTLGGLQTHPYSFSTAEIRLSHLVHLKQVTLCTIRMTDSLLRVFIDCLPHTPHTLEVVLKYVEIFQHTVDYIKTSTSFPSQVWEYKCRKRYRGKLRTVYATLKTV